MQVLSFVYERQRLGDTKSGIPEDWNSVYASSIELCKQRFSNLAPSVDLSSLVTDRNSWLLQSIKALLEKSSDTSEIAISFLFAASQLVLPSLSIEQRAQFSSSVDPSLRVYLVSKFYPKLFGQLASSLDGSTFLPDLDGNVFLVFLNHIISSPRQKMEDFVGASLAEEILAAWASVDLAPPDFSILSTQFKSATTIVPSSSSDAPFELLPFSHPVLDKYLQSVAVHSSSQPAAGPDTRSRLDKLCDEPFVDEKHWHNAKSILPKHLGGKDDNTATNLSSWERMKQLKKDQRFMTNRTYLCI
jgi:hypothetical protein